MTPFETLTNDFVPSLRDSLFKKLKYKTLFVIYLDEAGFLKELERKILDYKKSVEEQLAKKDGNVWFPHPFRFVLPLDLLLMQSKNHDELVYLIVKEPELAIQTARESILCTAKEITGAGKTEIGMTESEIEIRLHFTVVPSVLFCTPESRPTGLVFLRGLLAAKSTPVKYRRSGVYVCRTENCVSSDYGERLRRPDPLELCRNCYVPLEEQVRFRDVGEEIVTRFVPGSESKKYFSFTALVKDELGSAVELELGKEYELVGKIEKNSCVDVWHIRKRSFSSSFTESHRMNFDNIYLPRFVSQLYLLIRNHCGSSPYWAFVIAISSLLGENAVPSTSFLNLKVGLMLSLATQSGNETPVHVLGIGRDTCTAGQLFRSAGRLAEKYVCYSADFAHLGGSVKRAAQQGAVWQEAGAMVLGTGGVLNLGDWSKFKKKQSDYVGNTLERGEIVFSNKDAEHNNLTHSVPLRCSVWSYFNEDAASNKVDVRLRLKTLADVFGMPFPLDEKSEEEIMKICKKRLGNNVLDADYGFPIPEEELKELMMLVRKRSSLPIREDASELIKNYFVASRKARPDCFPVGAIKTITALSEAHAKLALRTEVLYEDVVGVVYWYEEAMNVLFGPSIHDFKPPSNETEKYPHYVFMEKRLRSFKLWLMEYVDAFAA